MIIRLKVGVQEAFGSQFVTLVEMIIELAFFHVQNLQIYRVIYPFEQNLRHIFTRVNSAPPILLQVFGRILMVFRIKDKCFI